MVVAVVVPAAPEPELAAALVRGRVREPDQGQVRAQALQVWGPWRRIKTEPVRKTRIRIKPVRKIRIRPDRKTRFTSELVAMSCRT